MGNETLGQAATQRLEQLQDPEATTFCAQTRNQGIVVFTDGAENNSAGQKLRNEKYPGDGIDTSLEDVQSLKVTGARTPIYAIGVGNKVDREALEQIAAASGGRFWPMDNMGAVDEALDTVAEYFGQAYRMCTRLPGHLCGSLHVRVTHSYERDGVQLQDQTTHRVEVPCPVRRNGRVATVLLTMTATETTEDVMLTLVANTVNWVSPLDAPSVLFVLDDSHHGEFESDTHAIYSRLVASGYRAAYMEEPSDGLSIEDIADHDVVWFSNPGYPMDDQKSFETLRAFSASGGGIVLQGDDMAQSFGKNFSLAPLNRLSSQDNGTSYCGVNIDNGAGGRYRVTMGAGPHPILDGLEEQTFLYGDDIDTALALDDALVLARATAEGTAECPSKPVVIAYSPR